MVHYTTNSISYINTLKEKYNKLYEKLKHRLEMYANAIRIISKGYLPFSLLPPTKLKEILDESGKPFKSQILTMILLLKDYPCSMI